MTDEDDFAVFDASAKIEAGILEGNTKWLGSFDECFHINQTLPGLPDSTNGIQTQFCGLEIPPNIAFIPEPVRRSKSLPFLRNICYGNM
jgi:hypothetical protein